MLVIVMVGPAAVGLFERGEECKLVMRTILRVMVREKERFNELRERFKKKADEK